MMHTLAGMKGSLPDIIWYSITPTLLPSFGKRKQNNLDYISIKNNNDDAKARAAKPATHVSKPPRDVSKGKSIQTNESDVKS